jgi:carbonic anhydrase/acetyltransferase-like protein (isoleucine patch superfamily)
VEQESGRGFLPTRLAIDPTAFVAPGAVVVGDVTIGAEASVWYGCVVRGDLEPITIGPRTNVQDGTVIHVDDEKPTLIGADVTIGHRCVIHGAILEDGCLIGMGAIVLSGARVGAGALVAAGAVVREGFVVPPRSLCVGVPAVVARQLDEAALERIRLNKEQYVAYAAAYRSGRLGGGAHGGH